MSRAPTDRPLRVLYVDASIGFGGACRSLAATLRALPGVEPRIATLQPSDLVRGWFGATPVLRFRRWINYRTLERARRAICRRVPTRVLRLAGSKLLAAADLGVTGWNALRLAWTARRHGVDLIHLNNGFLPLDALLAARLAGVPFVVHLRDFHVPGRSRFGGDWSRAAHVIAVSGAVADSLDCGPVPRSRISVIHDPVDVPRLEAAAASRDAIRAEWAADGDAVVVAIFGRVVEWKGQREFVAAVLEAMRHDAKIRAVVVGDESDGPREYLDAVRALAAASPFAARFTFAGYRADVEECYAAADVVVHASTRPEPFGMVVPEAMAAGRPVIAADAGGPREVVDHGVDGLLFPSGDVAALATAILRLTTDPAMRRRMGEAGRRKARERFRIETSAARVAGVYAQVLGGRAAPVARAAAELALEGASHG